MTAQPIRDAGEILDRTKAAGGHFFDPDTMRSFGSRLLSDVFPAAGGARSYFVTSEQDRHRFAYSDGTQSRGAWDGQRRFTVRAITWATGAIDEPDDDAFGAFSTRARAVARARQAAKDDTAGAAAWPCPLNNHRKYAQGIGLRGRVYCGGCLDDGANIVRHSTRWPVSRTAALAALR